MPKSMANMSAKSQNQTALGEDTDSSTFRDIQLRYKLSPPTVKTLLTVPKHPTRRDIAKTACCATEFRGYSIRSSERAFLRYINDHLPIPYPLTEPATQPWHKIFLLLQMDLLGQAWPIKLSAAARKTIYQERHQIYKILDTVVRCLTDILGIRGDGRGVVVALDVLRSVKAGMWEGSDQELAQVEGIGPKKMQKLKDAGVGKIKHFRKLEFHQIERLLSRNPPFGHQILNQLSGFPDLEIDVRIIGPHVDQDGSGNIAVTAWIAQVFIGFRNQELPTWKDQSPWTTLVIEGSDGRLVWFWRGSVKRLISGKEMILRLTAQKGDNLKVTFACEGIVGTLVRQSVQVQ